VGEISSAEGNRLLRIVPPALRVGGELAAAADRGCSLGSASETRTGVASPSQGCRWHHPQVPPLGAPSAGGLSAHRRRPGTLLAANSLRLQINPLDYNGNGNGRVTRAEIF